MRQRVLLLWAVIVLCGLLSGPQLVPAVTILFEATDLAAPGPGGGDLWHYTYHVTGFTPQAHVAFEILFDPTFYSDLQDPPPAVPDWDILTLQPDPNLPAPGRYSALALRDGASLTGPFAIEFVWLGVPGTTPGAQPFELNAFDAQGNFLNTLGSGRTQATAVPEPGTVILFVTGVVGIAHLKRRILAHTT